MNDTPRELDDESIRELLGQARLDTPTALDWDEVSQRHDEEDRGDRRRRRGWALAAAAAIVLVGGGGLIVALQLRSGDEDPLAGEPVVDPVPTSVEAAPVRQDPLAGLTTDDWVVPGSLPPGYELLVALMTPNGGPGGATLLFGGDDVDEIRISHSAIAGSSPPVDDSTELRETTEIDGVVWDVDVVTDGDGAIVANLLERRVDDRVVLLWSEGPPDALVGFAADLDVVPSADLEVPRLGPSTPTDTVVASIGEAEMAVAGANGAFCVQISTSEASGRGGCEIRTEPGRPVAFAVSMGGSTEWFAAGLAEPDVARIEFRTSVGETVVVEPVDESGSFDQRFWITDQPGVDLGSVAAIEITYDDGSTAPLVAGPAGRWTVADPTAGADGDRDGIAETIPSGVISVPAQPASTASVESIATVEYGPGDDQVELFTGEFPPPAIWTEGGVLVLEDARETGLTGESVLVSTDGPDDGADVRFEPVAVDLAEPGGTPVFIRSLDDGGFVVVTAHGDDPAFRVREYERGASGAFEPTGAGVDREALGDSVLAVRADGATLGGEVVVPVDEPLAGARRPVVTSEPAVGPSTSYLIERPAQAGAPAVTWMLDVEIDAEFPPGTGGPLVEPFGDGALVRLSTSSAREARPVLVLLRSDGTGAAYEVDGWALVDVRPDGALLTRSSSSGLELGVLRPER